MLMMGPSIGISVSKYWFIFEVYVYISISKVEGISILVSVLNILYCQYHDKNEEKLTKYLLKYFKLL